MSSSAVCNGFKLRPLNADCDRLAVQSSEQSTWLVGWKLHGQQHVHEVGIQQNELMVLRPYGGCPAFEIRPLGDRAGTLIVEAVRQFTRVARVGSWFRVELGLDESCVIKCGSIAYPTHPGVKPGAYGQGLAV